MEMEMKFNPPSNKQNLQMLLDGYRTEFADVKSRIFEMKGPVVHTSVEVEENADPEEQRLLNIHSELRFQEDNLVHSRKLGHESLQVGNELK
mmetsp:Transcript_35619/g.41233  ORF Transcript_35619/g.41233 Transcript_35619/m.41233 type:complete len:92 (-) Transcript_35619:129-404(-)